MVKYLWCVAWVAGPRGGSLRRDLSAGRLWPATLPPWRYMGFSAHCHEIFPELGQRQHCRDNVTMFSGQTMVDYCIMVVVATPFRHRGLHIFACHWRSIVLSRCRCRVVARLKIVTCPTLNFSSAKFWNPTIKSLELKAQITVWLYS